MRNVLVGLVTNRFGIVLATLSVCYFVARKFTRHAFSHGGGDDCVFLNRYIYFWMRWESTEIIYSINLPAITAAMFSSEALQILLPNSCIYMQAQFQVAFLLFFITLQWLFIGWTAKMLAQTVRSEFLKN